MTRWSAALMLYLRDPTASHPIEYFHSMFFAFYHEAPVTLWEIREKDPAYFRYVTDRGEETIAGHPCETPPEVDLSAFPEQFGAALSEEENGECAGCEFFTNCGGYFKWPRRDFRCDTMKHLFRILKDAAAELKKDEAAFLETHGGNQL